jgi:Zn-dependent peptidase ImmA (M78 family)/DNA-binding XRE family transcriptional regulator
MNGDRLRIAREYLGWSQTELAQRLQVTQSTIAYIESGRFIPSEALATRICLTTGFSNAYFQQSQPVQMGEGSLLYRSKVSQARQGDKAKAYRFGQLILDLNNRLLERIKPIPVLIPRLAEEPAEAARLTRSILGLAPDTPIAGLINLLERKGIIVAVLPEAFDGIDGYSTWTGPDSDRPLVVVAPNLPPDRLRFTVAHELGHLVMHSRVGGGTRVLEDESNVFAGEFMMPLKAVTSEIQVPVSLSDLATLKTRWGLSIQALIFRAEKAGLVNTTQKQYLFKQLNKRGWKENEPFSDMIPAERPRAIRQLMEMAYGASPNVLKVALDTGLPAGFVEAAFYHGAASGSAQAKVTRPVAGKVVEFKSRKA